jgi:hypothetical protein
VTSVPQAEAGRDCAAIRQNPDRHRASEPQAAHVD